MADVVGPKVIEAVVTKVTDEAIDSVWRQIGYVRNYKSNIRDLENQLAKLKAEKDGMLHSVEEATRKGDEIENNVTIWLKNADDAIQAADNLLGEHDAANKSCFMGCCPNLLTRHQFSRKAKKEATPALAKVQQDRDVIHKISYPIDVQQLEPLKNYEALGSRIEILEEIMVALKSSDVNLIGVYGFAGVGKSTLVKQQVVAQVKENNIFKVVAVANVTHSWDLKTIQQEIADWLGLDFSVASAEVRAARLCARLKKEERVLIILDDIWETIPLEKIGIPPNRNDHEGCKIIMTSRDQNILLKMGVQKHFKLEVVQEDEAWQLFKTKAGDLSNSRIQSVATEVAKRCSGLPVVIVAVATSLRDKHLCEWNDALEQLQKFDHSEMWDQVYSALELSYKFLGHDAKSILLLCAQLPCSVRISDLVKYSMGLDLFRNCSSIKAVRNRVLKVVNDLKKSCFLLEESNELRVRMHDLVHSFAAFIASKEHNVFTLNSTHDQEEWPEESAFERCTAISLLHCKIRKLPEVLECPKLESFLLDNRFLKVSEDFFTRTKSLKLVDLSDLPLLPALPLSLGFLNNLRTLCLDRCDLEDISAIGELKKLQVLSLLKSNIVQLPMEIRNLTRLQFLDLTGSGHLRVIPPGILNCLTKLEELCMLGTFVHWESEGDIGQSNNASLSELKNLPNLINLDINIMDANMIPADLFHEKLERFKIFIGNFWYGSELENIMDANMIPSNLLKLQLNADVELERVKVLLAVTEDLHLDDVKGVQNVLPQLDGRGFPELKKLLVQSCYDVESIIDKKTMGGIITFPSLELLVLRNLNRLKGICSGQLTTDSFSNLKELKVGNCNALRFLFSFSVFRCLIQLQLLDVSHCVNLEMIVGYEDGDDDVKDEIIKLARLTDLILQNLPMLVSFFSPTTNNSYGEISSTTESRSFFNNKVEFPNLEKLEISGGNGLKAIWNDEVHENSFAKLKHFNIENAKELAKIFPWRWGMKRLQNLEVLKVKGCDALTEVFEMRALVDDDAEERDGTVANTQLRVMSLINLPNLKHIWGEDPKGFVNFQGLSYVYIEKCPCLKTVFPASVAKGLVHLETLLIFDSGMEQIIAGDEGGSAVFEFPMLKLLVLRGLSQLKSFCLETSPLEWPALQRLVVTGCKNFQLSIPSQKKIIPNLEEIALNGKEIEMIREGQLPKMIFHKLKVVELNFSDNCSNSFPFDILHMFKNLETLRVVRGNFEELFPSEGLSGDEKHQMSFTKIHSLKLYNSTNLKTIWNEALKNLESLLLNRCDGFIILAPSSASFKCLTSLRIENCRALLSLVSSSTAKSLVQLKTLIVRNCNQLKVIVSDERDETMDEINFINLETLELECLPSLASFCSENHKFNFPCLINIVATQCPRMEFFPNGVSTTPKLQCVRLTEAADEGEWVGDINSTISLSYRKMVGLQHLKVSEYPNLKNGLNDELPVELFWGLESLVIDEIAFLSYAVPSNLLESLNKLEKLEVSNCEVLEEVFDVQIGSSAGSGRTDLLSTLKRFQLINLPRLRNIWNDHPQAILNFKHLNSLKVHHCSSLKTIFTPSIAEGLVGLLEVEVRYCSSVEEIVSKGAGDNAITFPLLQSFTLESLPALLSLNGGSNILKCPSLEHIEIVDCPTSFTSKFLRELQSNAFDGTFEAKVVLPKLYHLKVCLVAIEKIWYSLEMSAFTENLTILNIDGCGKLMHLFSSSMVLNGYTFIHVKSLEISNCKSMKEVVQMETSENMVLSNLETVKLKNLQQLTRFCSGNSIECDGLIEVLIQDCPELGEFISTCANPNNTATLFDEKVKFPKLKRLTIDGVDGLKLIWGNELQQDQLNYLYVRDAKQLIRVFPPNLLGELRNLESLYIQGCDTIEEVFDIKALTDVEQRGEVVVTQLKTLWVVDNPNLKHMWNEDPKGILRFQNLNLVYVKGCPSLKSVFPASITRDLLVLEVLDVRESAIEAIIAGDEEPIQGPAVFDFPRLKRLLLDDLPKLERFCPTTHASEWPALQKLRISKCYQFQQPTLSFEKIIPNLEILNLDGKEVKMICDSRFPVELLRKLVGLGIECCDEKSAVFPYALLHPFQNLETLAVFNCKCKVLFPTQHFFIPTRMHHLILQQLPNLRAIWTEGLQTLETLTIEVCDSLNILAPSSASFECLASLIIDECNGLVSLVTCSVAKRLTQLLELRINNCNKIKVIVSDEEDETTYEICFSKLTTLGLVGLPSLTCFCSVNCNFQFPCLTEVLVNQCPNMEFFSEGVSNSAILERVNQNDNCFWLGNLNSTIHFLYKKMVGFCGMQYLKLSEFSNLKDRWYNELPAEFLYKLKSLAIDEAVFSSYAIPSNLLESLNKLEELEVYNCELLGEVFHLEGLSDKAQSQRGMLPKLSRFRLINLPRLRQVWNEHPLLNFKHLKTLKVDNCSRLRMIFTPSMTHVLVQLQEIEVKNCVSVEEIISEGREEAETDQVITFPKLNSLVLNSLPKLTTFHSGKDIVKCPSLEKITSMDCPEIDLFTFSAYDEGTLIFFKKVKCPSLKVLRVDWGNSIKKIWDGELESNHELFFSLKVLELKHFPFEYSFLPSNFLERMSPNLEEFIVNGASFGEIFSQEGATVNEEESSTRAIPLRQLTLSNLPLLGHLIKDQAQRDSLVPHLEALEVQECTKLTILVPSFCSFQNLKTLTVSKCHGLLYLVTPSTARSLSQLMRFEIAECEMVEEIVSSEGDEIEAEIELSQLKHLELRCLPKIRRFCPGNAAFRFPCLEEATVRECPEMEIFVEGELSTPNLEGVLITEDESEWCWEGDLNATIHKLFHEKITGDVKEH